MTEEQLDKDLDSYFNKDPETAQQKMDDDLDAYWNNANKKTDENTEVAEPVESEQEE